MNLIFIAENNKENINFSKNVLKNNVIINGFWNKDNKKDNYEYNFLKNSFLINNRPLDPSIKSSIYVLSRKYPFNPDAIIIKGGIYECASLSILSEKEFSDIPCIAFVDESEYPLDDVAISLIDKLDNVFWLDDNEYKRVFFKSLEKLSKENSIIRNIYEKIHIIKEFYSQKNNKFNDDKWIENILDYIQKDISNFFENNPKETIMGEEI